MESHFASPERASETDLLHEIRLTSENPVINGVLKYVSGLLALLNEHRQILAVNMSLLNMLGIDDADELIGLRPGEAVNCIHAGETSSGCGTTMFCSSCGAAISIVTSLATKKPAERLCALTAERKGAKKDFCFLVRACPVIMDKKIFILLFLTDITRQQQLIAMEDVFFHDINNLLSGLVGLGQVMVSKDDSEMRDIAGQMGRLSMRLYDEMAVQRTLTVDKCLSYNFQMNDLSLSSTLNDIREIFIDHPASKNKELKLPEYIPGIIFSANYSLLLRILMNMLINAFEGTEKSGTVKLWVEHDNDQLTFCVWNRGYIPEDIQRRIFQRYFTTKKDGGRGLGTYSMKLLGEEIMGGKVDFISFESEGTIFRFTLRI